VDPLVVDHPASVPRCLGSSSPPPPGTTPGEAPEERTQGQLLVGGYGSWQALGGPGLVDETTSTAFGDPELLTEGHDGPPAAVRG